MTPKAAQLAALMSTQFNGDNDKAHFYLVTRARCFKRCGFYVKARQYLCAAVYLINPHQ